MNQTSHFGYTDTPSAQILEMRYAGTGIAFDVLLPKTLGGLPGLETSLTFENLSGWLGNLSTRNVQVSLLSGVNYFFGSVFLTRECYPICRCRG
jgi:serine protease inhibitor